MGTFSTTVLVCAGALLAVWAVADVPADSSASGVALNDTVANGTASDAANSTGGGTGTAAALGGRGGRGVVTPVFVTVVPVAWLARHPL